MNWYEQIWPMSTSPYLYWNRPVDVMLEQQTMTVAACLWGIALLHPLQLLLFPLEVDDWRGAPEYLCHSDRCTGLVHTICCDEETIFIRFRPTHRGTSSSLYPRRVAYKGHMHGQWKLNVLSHFRAQDPSGSWRTGGSTLCHTKQAMATVLINPTSFMAEDIVKATKCKALCNHSTVWEHAEQLQLWSLAGTVYESLTVHCMYFSHWLGNTWRTYTVFLDLWAFYLNSLIHAHYGVQIKVNFNYRH